MAEQEKNKADISLGAPYKLPKPLKPYKPKNPSPIDEYRAWVKGALPGQTITVMHKSFRYIPNKIGSFLCGLEKDGLIEIWVICGRVKIKRTRKNVRL